MSLPNHNRAKNSNSMDLITIFTFYSSVQFSSVQFSRSVVSNSLWPYGLQHASPPCPSPTPRACSNSCPSSRCCHPTTSSSVVPSTYLQSFPASKSFPRSPFFTPGGQSIGASASISVLPMNIQDWFPLGFTGLIFLKSKGLSRVFSNTIVWKHQFFSTLSSLWSNSHIHTWLLLETSHNFNYMGLCQQSDISAF